MSSTKILLADPLMAPVDADVVDDVICSRVSYSVAYKLIVVSCLMASETQTLECCPRSANVWKNRLHSMNVSFTAAKYLVTEWRNRTATPAQDQGYRV